MNTTVTPNPKMSGNMAERAAGRADDALLGARRFADQAAHTVQAGIDDLRDAVPGAVSRVAAGAEDLTRRGLERARLAADAVRHRAADLGDATAHRIQDQPMKAVLIAAAVGAGAMLLMQWLARSRQRSM